MRKDSMRRVKMNGVLMVNLQVKKFWLTLILCCKFWAFHKFASFGICEDFRLVR